jgi:hypothetical protein
MMYRLQILSFGEKIDVRVCQFNIHFARFHHDSNGLKIA